VAGGPSDDADFSMGVVHAPYLRTLDAFTADGYPLILGGHTHGGQLCIPFYGALVTNCDLDTDRVKGLSTAYGGGADVVHARIGGVRDEPLHAGAVRLPAGGDVADVGGAGLGDWRGRRYPGALATYRGYRGSGRGGARARGTSSSPPVSPLSSPLPSVRA
jgi:hypothetical protein